jgi:hypothetical protein
MADELEQLWDDVEEAFLENDTDTPIHSLLVFRVFERKIREGYCRELGMEPEVVDSLLEELADVSEDIGPKSAETVREVADQVEDIHQDG